MPHMVAVKFLGFLERVAGHRETRVEVDDGATVLDLVAMLAERYGPEFSASVFRAPRQVHTHLRVFLNEEEVGVDDCIARDGSGTAEVTVLVLPAFEGGSR